jgi:DNA-binding transcriptional MerR regulator
LAIQLGLKPTTIRYYEALGLLPEPPRSAAGYRLYTAADATRLGFIRKARALGLHLDAIQTLLTLRDGGTAPCDQLVTTLNDHIAQLDQQIQALATLRADLIALRSAATGPRAAGASICPVIEEY